MSRPLQHDAHVRAAIVRHDVYLPNESLARIGLADSSDHELDMVSVWDVATEWDLNDATAAALLAEARESLPRLEPPPPVACPLVSSQLPGAPRGQPHSEVAIMTRRARLLAFLTPWTTRDGGYAIRVGRTVLSAEILTDDALEDLAARVVDDFWSTRRQVRLNRPHYVADAIRAGHHLPASTARLAAA